ncbi:MAG TPA: sigma-E factor regulatory protein RseB domain-containing protein [Methylophilaceae bacterium]|nr:sigma-E factor regulatory protein RseB domain-containing protein [Methylophilaceae bacterium]
MRGLLACLCTLPLFGQAAGKEAVDDPWLMLEKAGQAAHKLSYKGIFVYQSGPIVSSMQIIHMNYAQGEFARLVSLDGAPREVLRQGNDVLIYNQQKEKVMIEKRRVQNSFPALLPGLVDAALKANYQARSAGMERVGGREVQIIHLVPRDRYRYGCHFSVDR